MSIILYHYKWFEITAHLYDSLFYSARKNLKFNKIPSWLHNNSRL